MEKKKTKRLPMKERMRKAERLRSGVQAGASLLTNAQLSGYVTGNIYQGPIKNICVPGLNCYSCPGAIGACPIGSLQNSLYDANQFFPFYVLGLLFLMGSVFGRAICGWLCPFGFLQELLYKIKTPKLKLEHSHPRLDKALRPVKYVMLFGLAIALPFMGRFIAGLASPWFCKLVCPAGTSLAGWPLVLLNADLRALLGFLFGWKSLLAIGTLGASIAISRVFCKYLCPLGAFYGLFNRLALYRLRFEKSACIDCGMCEKVCPMGIAMPEANQSPECIRCGKCQVACPKSCLEVGFKAGEMKALQLMKPAP